MEEALVKYSVTAFVETLDGRYQTPFFSDIMESLDAVYEKLEQLAVNGADTITIKITRAEKDV